MSTTYHLPVLAEETLRYLNPTPGKNYVDATLGGGGHAERILEAIKPGGTLIAFDQDPEAVSHSRERLKRFGSHLYIYNTNFRNIEEARHLNLPISGILMDIGVSSRQLDEASRGFSFIQDGPLDMRMDPRQGLTAAELLKSYGEKELADIIFKYGEERFSRRIARRIKEHLSQGAPLERTLELARLVERSVPRTDGRIHPATRVFQALRIEVNRELESLEQAMEKGLALLEPGGRMVIITFHSLEDRIVKDRFRLWQKGCICPPELPVCLCRQKPAGKVLTSKPVIATPEEVERNPRARSAKLRAFEKL